MLTSLFSLFYVTGEFHRFLHRGRADLVRRTFLEASPLALALSKPEPTCLEGWERRHGVTVVLIVSRERSALRQPG